MPNLVRAPKALARQMLFAGQVAYGRLQNVLPTNLYMKGAYASYEEALASQPKQQMVGYDNKEVVPVLIEMMSQVLSWDYAIMFWLDRLLPQNGNLIDAGGHIGTKYRAFQTKLKITPCFDWVVYDLPAIIEEGRARAAEEGFSNLHFESDTSRLPATDLLLASGLLQYYPHNLSNLLKELPRLPRHVLVNKVAVRDGAPVFTMQAVGPSRIPYQIRCKDEFINDMLALGYEIVDSWDIPSLSHTIQTHPDLGASQSLGFYFRKLEASNDI